MMLKMRAAVRRAQSGVAMVATMLVIFVLTIVVAALILATMGETTLSFDQSRDMQALHLAEGGANRALAELRRRISVDLDTNIRTAPGRTLDREGLADLCEDRDGWRLIATYAGPGWTNDDSGRRAILPIGSSGTPIEVRDAGGNVLGSFFATIYVRLANNTPAPEDEEDDDDCDDIVPESYQIHFDYFIVATGITRNARRTICLKNPGNTANCGAWLASATPGAVTWDSNAGWLLLLEKASYARWAMMLLETSDTWLFSTSTFDGPVHTNARLWIWGNPAFNSSVAQVAADVQFGNGGTPVLLPASTNPPTDAPVYTATALEREAAAIAGPTNNNPHWAVLGDDPGRSGQPADSDVRNRTTQLPNTLDPVPDGIYFMDECGLVTCGGLFIKGDILNLVLGVELGKQVMYVTTAGETVKVILESATNTRVCTGVPFFSVCVDRGKGFNGMLFVQGSITSTFPNTQTGLYGTVQNNTRLTIAADGEIRVTDHIVYQDPPSGPGDTVQNMLGLYAWCSTPDAVNPNACAGGPPRNVTVDGWLAPGPPLDATVQDLYIDAAVLAPWGEFWVEGWDATPDKGTLRFLGGAVQNSFGAWGGFDADGNLTGYGRNMIYDQRLGSNVAPPFFPLTDFYAAPRWPRFDDLLYDRPLWQELTQP